ncbi:translation initiation factor IF-2 [Madurella fahalii]|uniref:Translation initiation factor IF-2 n=1 Tax=Madurella fahalii TaxID=1157608 RepID=A0ABQ0GIU5_9PEZI
MMRRGLWPEKRPSACLLCRYSYASGRCIRSALLATSSSSGGIQEWTGRPRQLEDGLGPWSVIEFGSGDGAPATLFDTSKLGNPTTNTQRYQRWVTPTRARSKGTGREPLTTRAGYGWCTGGC